MSQNKSRASKPSSATPDRPARADAASKSTSNQNARAVQLMRQGEIDKAVSVLRSLVIPPGCIWTRPDAPHLIRRNYATALLLAGHPAGCLELLAELHDDQHPRVQQLRAAIKRWEKTLSLLQWLNWRTGWIEPSNRPVAIDFVPGELEGESLRPETLQTGSTGSHLSTAI